MEELTSKKGRGALAYVKWGLWALLLLFLGALVWLHTPQGKGRIKKLVEDGVASQMEGSLTVRELDYALFGSIRLEGLSLRDLSGAEVLRLDEAEIKPSWGTLLTGTGRLKEISIDGLHLALQSFDDGSTNLDRMRKGPAELPKALFVDLLSLKNSDVKITQVGQNGSQSQRFDDISLAGKLALEGGGEVLDFEIQPLQFNFGFQNEDVSMALPFEAGLSLKRDEGGPLDLNFQPKPSQGSFSLNGEEAEELTVVLGSIEGQMKGLEMELKMAPSQIGPLFFDALHGTVDPGEGMLSLALEGGKLNQKLLSKLIQEDPISGDVDFDLSAKGPLKEMKILGGVNSKGGKLSLTGAVNVLKQSYQLVLEGSEIRPQELLTEALPMAWDTGFLLTLDGKGFGDKGSFRAKLDFGKTRIWQMLEDQVLEGMIDEVSLEANVGPSEIEIEQLKFQALGQALLLKSRLDLETREWTASLGLDGDLQVTGELFQGREPLVEESLRELLGFWMEEGELSGELGGKIQLESTFKADALEAIKMGEKAREWPFESLEMRGGLKGDKLQVMGNLAELWELSLELQAKGEELSALEGELDMKLQGLMTKDKLHIDELGMRLLLHGLEQELYVTGKDEGSQWQAKALLKNQLKGSLREGRLSLDELAFYDRNHGLTLESPALLFYAEERPNVWKGRLAQSVMTLTRKNRAGQSQKRGSVRTHGEVKVPLLSPLETELQWGLDLESVNLGQVFSLLKKPSKGLAGEVSMVLDLRGSLAAPALSAGGTFQVQHKKNTKLFGEWDLAFYNEDLGIHASVQRQNQPWLLLDAKLPFSFSVDESGKFEGDLLRGKPLNLDFEFSETRVSELEKVLGLKFQESLDKEALVSAAFGLRGTASRPEADWNLLLQGDVLKGMAQADSFSQQKLQVKGKLLPEKGGSILTQESSLWLESAASAVLEQHVEGHFGPSLLSKRPLSSPWRLQAEFKQPVDLSRLQGLPGLEGLQSGKFLQVLSLKGRGQDLTGDLELVLEELRLEGLAAPIGLQTGFRLDDEGLSFQQRGTLGAEEVLLGQGEIGLPGKRFFQSLKQKRRMKERPLALSWDLKDAPIGDWLERLGLSEKLLPERAGGAEEASLGKLHGEMTLSGSLGAPKLQGLFAWDDFQTLVKEEGALRLSFEAQESGAGLELRYGGKDAVALTASLQAGGRGKEGCLELGLDTKGLDLKALFPSFLWGGHAAQGEALPLQGMLDSDLKLSLPWPLQDEDGAYRFQDGRYEGRLEIKNFDFDFPDMDRRFQDGHLELSAGKDGLSLKELSLREEDIERKDRRLKLAFDLPWSKEGIGDALLRVKTEKWLLLGEAFDGPVAEMDSEIEISLSELQKPVKKVDVTVKELFLNAPDRFVRAHYPQVYDRGDVLFVSEALPSGKLPYEKPSPKKAKSSEPTTEVLEGPESPEKGFDIALDIPKPIEIIFADTSPLELTLKGKMAVKERGGELQLDGDIEVLDGMLSAMGMDYDLIEGSISASGGLETAKVRLFFGHLPYAVTLRDIARGGHQNLATITVLADAEKGLQTIFGGVSGPYLLDMATLLNTGRSRLWGEPDIPSSQTIRYGNSDQGLVNSFIQTNLRDMVFMDRFSGYSDSLERPLRYGQLRHFKMERFLPAAGREKAPTSLLRFLASPLEPGQGEFRFDYHWLLYSKDRAIFGAGPFLDSDLRLGLGLLYEWSSED